MKKALGLILLVFAMLAGASAATTGGDDQKGKAANPAERFGMAIGGALFALAVGGTGLYLLMTADRGKKSGKTRKDSELKLPDDK